MGSKGDSYDNALAETINGLYKAELIHRWAAWKTRQSVELATLEWVHWFNHVRLLTPIGSIPPAEAEANYWRQTAAAMEELTATERRRSYLMVTRKIKPETRHYANHDSVLCLAPGLFRSLCKGKREEGKRESLDFEYSHNEKMLFRFSAPQALGVDDLRILQGLLALASAWRKRWDLTPASEGSRAAVLREHMNLEPDAQGAKIVSLDASVPELADAIGYLEPGGGNVYKLFNASVERLSKVSIAVEHQDGRREGYRLLSRYSSEKKSGVLSVALNPRLSEAVLGAKKAGASYFRIDMDEVRALKTDAARLLHQRLQWLPAYGGSRPVNLNTLCEYVWPDEADGAAMRKRRFTVRKALVELEKLGWEIAGRDGEKLEISRPIKPMRRKTPPTAPATPA